MDGRTRPSIPAVNVQHATTSTYTRVRVYVLSTSVLQHLPLPAALRAAAAVAAEPVAARNELLDGCSRVLSKTALELHATLHHADKQRGCLSAVVQ